MCAVSVMLGYMEERVPLERWTQTRLKMLQGILDSTALLDKELGQPDCVDPNKAAWLERIRAQCQQ